jgi:hypothetical protein
MRMAQVPNTWVSLWLLLFPCSAQAQEQRFPLRSGGQVEFSAAQLFIAGSNAHTDNILDRERGDATWVSATYLLGDTTNHGRGIGRLGFGLGVAALRWEGITLLPVFGQVDWYPFIRRTPWAGIHLQRLGIVLRYGGIFGAWKPTDRGQLAGNQYAELAVRYPMYLGRVRLGLEAGFGIIVLRGPYTIVEAGVPEDRRFAEFMHPRVGVSVGF